jgi:hypothetical protein
LTPSRVNRVKNIDTGCGAHLASCPKGPGGSFPRRKSGRGVKLTTHLHQESMDLFSHSPIRLHGILLNCLRRGKTVASGVDSISSRNDGRKGRPEREADYLTTICELFVCGSLDVSQPYGPARPVSGIALSYSTALGSAIYSVQLPSRHVQLFPLTALASKHIKFTLETKFHTRNHLYLQVSLCF